MANIFKNSIKLNVNELSKNKDISNSNKNQFNNEVLIPNSMNNKKNQTFYSSNMNINTIKPIPFLNENSTLYPSSNFSNYNPGVNKIFYDDQEGNNFMVDNLINENTIKMNKFLVERNKEYSNEDIPNNILVQNKNTFYPDSMIDQFYDPNINPMMFYKFPKKSNKVFENNQNNFILENKNENFIRKPFTPRNKFDSLGNTSLSTLRPQHPMHKNRNVDSVERRARKKSFLSEEVKDCNNEKTKEVDTSNNYGNKNLNPTERIKNLKLKIKKKNVDVQEEINSNSLIKKNQDDNENKLNLNENSNNVKNSLIRLISNKSLTKSNSQQKNIDCKKSKNEVSGKNKANKITNDSSNQIRFIKNDSYLRKYDDTHKDKQDDKGKLNL